MTARSIILFMARAVDFAVPLGSCSMLSLSYDFFPQFPYLAFVTRRQAGSVAGAIAPGETLDRYMVTSLHR